MKITHTNEILLPAHLNDERRAERLLIKENVDILIQDHELFQDDDVTVTYAETGIASFVCMIQKGVSQEIFVLKIPLAFRDTSNEHHMLDVWAEAGVTAPKVLFSGTMNGYEYLLMNYVDAPLLRERYFEKESELFDDRIYFKMGQTLRQMHSISSSGYGMIENTKGVHLDFNDYLQNDVSIEVKHAYVSEQQLITNQAKTLPEIKKALLKHISPSEQKSCYMHGDFSLGNIFIKDDELIVFDPNPICSHPYMDVARTIVCSAIFNEDVEQACEQIVEGYFEDKFNRDLLFECLIFQTYMKFVFWHKNKKTHRIEKINRLLNNFNSLF